MSSLLRQWGVGSLFALAFAGATFAQQPALPYQDGAAPAETPAGTPTDAPADPAKKYFDLKKSKTRATKALADRYDALMGTQEWVDASGKFKIKARYVGHDPDLKWIKLTTGPGKESTIELSKLNKTSQGKVRQIAALQKKLDELAAAEKEDPAGSPEYGASASDGRGEMGDGEARGRSRGTNRRGNRGEQREREQGAEQPQAEQGQSEIAPGPPQPWQSSYEAFRANFSTSRGEGNDWSISFGELHDLKAVADLANFAFSTDRSTIPPAERKRIMDDGEAAVKRMGKVTWVATIKRRGTSPITTVVEFDLPKLPEPLGLSFRVDVKGGSTGEEWSKFSSGDRVRFAGKLHMANARDVWVYVRAPELVQAAESSPAGSPTDTPPASDNPFGGVE